LAGATILVVEDEDQVRTLIARVLAKRGYQVLQAENGRAGLALAREHAAELALIVTDLVMPEMGGAPLLREVRKLNSDLPALCMTGYTQEEVASLDGLQDVSLIEKPFTPTTFLERIDLLLGKAGNQS
jgi:two-component system cell cycle sensor histidine kinase/response regulator CckA